MWNRKLLRALPVVLLVTFLVAPPALAAPSADAANPVRAFQVIAEWWADLTRPMVRMFDLHRQGADPNGASTATADGPTVETENRAGADPNG